MDPIYGIGMFFIGVPITIIGFFIAYTIAYKSVMSKDEKKLTEVQKSIKDLYGQDCE
tara:strand:+ start:122 stop:292 length:171 start_codon:yes stop_codon:yes gene_type:complete